MDTTRGTGKIIVVYNESPLLIKGEPQDVLAEQGVTACAQVVASALAQRFEVRCAPIRVDAEVALAGFPPTEWIIFNPGGRRVSPGRSKRRGYRMTGSYGRGTRERGP